MSISILNKKNIEAGEIIPRKTVVENGEEELELVVNLENRLFKRLGYRPTLELNSAILPVINGFPLTVIMLLVNRDYKLIFDCMWNFYEEESKFFYNAMSKQDKIKVIFINLDNGFEKIEEIGNDFKKQFCDYIEILSMVNASLEDFKSSVRYYKQKIDKRVLWQSGLMRGNFVATCEINKEQVLEGNLINFAIDKSEVVSMNFDRINEVIKIFEDCGKKAKGNLIITFAGYDYTSLEIFEIREIRKYVEMMFKEHNNLFYFLSNIQNSNISILACLVETNKTTTNGITMNMQINLGNGPTDEILSGFIDYADKVNDISRETLKLLFSITNGNSYIPQNIFLRTKLEDLKLKLF